MVRLLSILGLLLLLVQSVFPVKIAVAAEHAVGDRQTPLTFAVIPFYSPDKIWTLYTPFVEFLNKSTGRPWTLKLYHDHNSFVSDLCNGKISLALSGPVPLVRANAACGTKPMLAALGRDATPYYHSVVLTASPAISAIRDLSGKKIAYFKGSTAAHVVPFAMLQEGGVPLGSVTTVPLQSQDSMINALLSGEVDAAGVKENLYRKLGNTPLKVVAKSPPLPNFAMCAGRGFPAAVRRKLTESLLSLAPLRNKQHAALTGKWDDELKFGFVVPDEKYQASLLKLKKIYEDMPN